ncbi:7776_t:CDS:2, partial [Funneliformis caledonium]
MSRTSKDRFDELLHNYPKFPKKPLAKSSLPFKIGSKITIKNYNTFLHNYGSSGYKFWFNSNNDTKTGEVYIIDMASTVHEDVVSRLQKFFEIPNNGVVDDPLIRVSGQP